VAAADVTLNVNGIEHELTLEPRTLLVHALRDDCELTGTKVGCDTSQCGACTVIVDGRALKSCTLLAVRLEGARVTTIEGISENGELGAIQRGFRDWHGLQCGFCTPGMVMSAVGLLARDPDPDEHAIRRAIVGNLCRCTGYQPIVESVLAAAESMRGGS
jgi:carbon-monoxide dehydrogenase small subunit